MKRIARRLVGIEEFQIFEAALRIVLRMADQDAVAMGAGFVFEADEDVGEIRIADIGRDDEDHVGATKAQAAGHGIGRVAVMAMA